MRALIFNPGSASLKFEIIDTQPRQRLAGEARKLLSAAIEEIGKIGGGKAKLSLIADHATTHTETVDAHDMPSATHFAVDWLRQQQHRGTPLLDGLDFLGVRVVHGGMHFDRAVRFTDEVRHKIHLLEDLAPLHNKSSLQIVDAAQQVLPRTPVAVAFDTAFHQTLPEYAWRYAIEKGTADQHGIRKFGFHGISHRYMLERYAQLTGRAAAALSLVTLHMESGSSACAIQQGRSIDTTMGLTPLEGLMMGTRSGSIDPAIVPLLMRKQNLSGEGVLTLLNKQSGMQGIAGELDTRVLVKRDDPDARLALRMFSYRVRLAVGAYAAALGEVDAILFGGGIGEDSPAIREDVCDGLRAFGLELDHAVNNAHTSGDGPISRASSRLAAHVIAPEECLQIAHECSMALSPGQAA